MGFNWKSFMGGGGGGGGDSSFGGDVMNIAGGVMDWLGADTSKKAARKAAERRRAMLEGGFDWEPESAASNIVNPKTGDASYTRAESPAANVYLDSFLGGYNPQAVTWSGDPAAEKKRASAQAKMDRLHGSWGEDGRYRGAEETVAARERELRDQPLYTVKPTSRKVKDDSPSAVRARGGKVLDDLVREEAWRRAVVEGNKRAADAQRQAELEGRQLSDMELARIRNPQQYMNPGETQSEMDRLREEAAAEGVDINNNQQFIEWYNDKTRAEARSRGRGQ